MPTVNRKISPIPKCDGNPGELPQQAFQQDSLNSCHPRSRSSPQILLEHIPPFNWDVRKIWEIDAEVAHVPTAEFAYLLELPLWSSVAKQGLLFDIHPMDVIRHPSLSAYQTQRLEQAGLQYPIDVLVARDKRWVLDGVHRIAKHFMLNSPALPVRFHDEFIIRAIRVD